MEESEAKEPLDGSGRESEKVGLKLNIQKTNMMASGSITSWQIDVETAETVADFILGGSPKIKLSTKELMLLNCGVEDS